MTYRERLLALDLADREFVRDENGEFAETPGGADEADAGASAGSGASARVPAPEPQRQGPLGEARPRPSLPTPTAPKEFTKPTTAPKPKAGSDGKAAPAPKAQSVPPPPVRDHPVPAPAVRAGLASVMTSLRPDEQKALQDGYAQYQKSGQTGSLEDFFAEQVALYRHAPEGDPRVTTFFYGDSLSKVVADPAMNAYIDDLVAYQKSPASPAAKPTAGGGGGGGGGGAAAAPKAPKAPKAGGGGGAATQAVETPVAETPVETPVAETPVAAPVETPTPAASAPPSAGEAGTLGPQVEAAVGAMRPDEQQALTDGYATAQASGYTGTLDDYFVQQVALYQHAEEGDPRITTFFYGDTLTKVQQDPTLWARVQEIIATQPPTALSYREKLAFHLDREYVRDDKGQFATTGGSGDSAEPHPYLRPGETEGESGQGMRPAASGDQMPTPATVKDWGHASGVLHAAGDETAASADTAPEVGKPFIVYRLGRPNGGLDNRNAGNAEGVADHIMRVQDPEAPGNQFGAGDHVTAYRVVVTEPFTEYIGAVGGRGGKNVGSGAVGREATAYKANAQYGVPEGRGQVRYSFAAGGAWTATPIATRSLAEIEKHLGSSMDYAGGLASADAIREMFTTKTLAYHERLALLLDWDEAQHPRDDHGRFGSGGGGGDLTAGEQALQTRLVDFKVDRNLTGPRSQAITESVPGSSFSQYVKVPGLDAMHAAMGVTPTLDTNPLEYQASRDALFAKLPEQTVPFDKLTFTQPRINRDRIESLKTAEAQLNKPVQLLKSGDQYYVMNGHHRAVAAHAAGRSGLKGTVFDVSQHLSADVARYQDARERFLLAYHGVINLPFAEYEDFDDCVSQNQDKDDPEAFCGWLKHRVEGAVYPGRVINLPDVADVNFPSLIGAIPSKPPKKKRRSRYVFKGVALSRKPMKFEVKVLALTAIPRRLDLARDTINARRDDGLLRATMEEIAQYGADEVMQELVRQGAPARVAPTVNISDVYATLVADRDRALKELRGGFEYRLCRRRIHPDRRDVLATALTGVREPGLLRRFGNRAINEAFAFGRGQSIALVRRQRVAVEYALAKHHDDEDDEDDTLHDEEGQFESKASAVAGGDITVDAIVQTAVMDTATCDACSEVDGEVMDLGSDRQEELHPPYVMCEGGDACRCVQIALLSDGSEIDVDEIDEDTLADSDTEDDF